MLWVGASFLFLWIDICIGHLNGEHLKTVMLIPIIFLPCVVLSALAAAFWPNSLSLKFLRVTCLLACGVGGLGFYFHWMRIQSSLSGSMTISIFVRLIRYPPLLAPLAISGLGILGLMIVRKRP